MNYTAHYNRLISRARERAGVAGYCEQHHVLPRCLGGTDEAENLVALTPEEHFLAHQLLVKIHPGNARLVFAAVMMTSNSPYAPRRNKAYGWIRRLVSEYRRGPSGIKHSEESKRARSEKLKGRPLSEETKQKLRAAWVKRRLEKPMTEETKQKLRDASYGRTHTQESRDKIAAARIGKPTRFKKDSYAI